jgi:hypothetical protein
MAERYRVQARSGGRGWQTYYEVARRDQIREVLGEMPLLEVRVIDTRSWQAVYYEPDPSLREQV